jgi:hypothetical protein
MALLNANPSIQEKDLAPKIGKTPKWFAAMKRGSFSAKPEVMAEIAKILDVPFEWLTHGTGQAPTWAPKPPPEHESIEKTLAIVVQMLADTQAEVRALRAEMQNLLPKKSSEVPPVKRRDRPLMELPIPTTVSGQ